MAIYCQFLPLKNDLPTPNENAAELFGTKPRIRNYCLNHKCPYEGEIDDCIPEKRSKHFGSGFVPASCYNGMLSGLFTYLSEKELSYEDD